jgi:hypothetical protein
VIGALGLLVGLQLVFFAIHAAHMLGYPYPLDYGEGPLLAQVNLLRGGTPVWRLYADPGLPPYAVVNYPPVYHLAAALAGWAVALFGGSTLLAGRLVSLAAALGCVVALWALTEDRRPEPGDKETRGQGDRAAGSQETAFILHPSSFILHPSSFILHPSSFILRLLIVLAFLAIPIVREWAVVMRVDMLGVCLGLWGLAIVRRNLGRRRLLWAALPLALSLLVKPSLIAAPSAALLWLLFRDWRRAVVLGLLIGLIGGLAGGLLQLGSGGWFALHVLAANANEWQRELAYGFWHDQLAILWPLVAAAVVSALVQVATRDWRLGIGDPDTNIQSPIANLLLPLYYTLFGAMTAYGVGKVGAYTNYFLEFYAGLIWLAALVTRRWTTDDRRWFEARGLSSIVYGLSSIAPLLIAILVAAGLLRYYPSWSETYLKAAGIIEGQNPLRIVVGGYGVLRDLRREGDILATLGNINAALSDEVRAAGAPIFTDVPGVAAQAGYLSRIQAFEHRQLLDAGLWDQRPLLRDMANGRVPLVVLDYLGNWLTPQTIELIKRRYAQDGSRGTYDLYRPVDPGPAVAASLPFPNGLRLVGYHLAPSPGRAAYHPGESVLLTLDWQRVGVAGDPQPQTRALEVVVQVTDGQGHVFDEIARPLLYGVLPPEDWGGEVMQHLQPIALSPEILPMDYHLSVTLRADGRDLAPPRALAVLPVEEQAGAQAAGYYVPAPLLAAWGRLGGEEGPGEPLTPAVPFRGYTLQCFGAACLRLEGSQVAQVPLGELVHLADVGLRAAPSSAIEGQESPQRFAETGEALSGAFLEYWRAHGGEAALGPPITPELTRGDAIVQYTRYARLERPQGGGAVRLGRLGEEYLRLPGGVPYRWP